ncbi:TIR domain-containing protein [Microbacteriaceae bacterium VKM Ac-2854]|nr:TIR domain-containing protein [Microbacteriaceae bacterium VKM Ac-2854]
MDGATYDAFWSYTHEDNDRQGGRVLDLAKALRDEFAVSTGDELELFVDRTALSWGDAWRDRIEEAVGKVPFFIPVVTPKFLRSEECRKEIIAFNREANSRGVGRLLLPIVYIDVPNLVEDSDDEVLALIARTQYVRWSHLRLKAPNDPAVLEATNGLALRLRDLRLEVSEVVLEIERKTDEQTEVQLLSLVEEIDNRLGSWMEAVDFDKVASRTWQVTLEERLSRIHRLQSANAPTGTIVSVLQMLGRELLPIAEDRLVKAKAYAQLSIELDPIVTGALRLVEVRPAYSRLLDSLKDCVSEAMLNITAVDNDDGFLALSKELRSENIHLTKAHLALDGSMTFVNEANDVVRGWNRKLLSLPAA